MAKNSRITPITDRCKPMCEQLNDFTKARKTIILLRTHRNERARFTEISFLAMLLSLRSNGKWCTRFFSYHSLMPMDI